MPDVTVSTATDLSGAAVDDVRRLAAAAAEADGVAPLSEQFLLELRPGSRSRHHLAYAGGLLAGYAQLAEGDAAELVVRPAHRRRGIGSALLAVLPPRVRIWAHGDVPGVPAFTAARGLGLVRELRLMRRPLGADSPALPDPDLPERLVVRTFEPGRDEEAWLRANAAAFAGHPEQGALTRGDLERRLAQPWFDPEGFFLAVPGPGRAGDPPADGGGIAAFHWTKVDPSDGRPAGEGEVYAVGVAPAYRGFGLGRAMTVVGLRHLESRGLRAATLYVDGDNVAARRTYLGLGFRDAGLDRMYSRGVHPSVRP